MGWRALLRALRQYEHGHGVTRQDALLVHGLPELLQRPHGHGDAILENTAAEVGDRHLSLPHEPQERVEHEAPPRLESDAENRLVHVAPYPRGMVGTTPGWVRWPRGSRRDVCGRQGEEHARH